MTTGVLLCEPRSSSITFQKSLRSVLIFSCCQIKEKQENNVSFIVRSRSLRLRYHRSESVPKAPRDFFVSDCLLYCGLACRPLAGKTKDIFTYFSGCCRCILVDFHLTISAMHWKEPASHGFDSFPGFSLHSEGNYWGGLKGHDKAFHTLLWIKENKSKNVIFQLKSQAAPRRSLLSAAVCLHMLDLLYTV